MSKSGWKTSIRPPTTPAVLQQIRPDRKAVDVAGAADVDGAAGRLASAVEEDSTDHRLHRHPMVLHRMAHHPMDNVLADLGVRDAVDQADLAVAVPAVACP